MRGSLLLLAAAGGMWLPSAGTPQDSRRDPIDELKEFCGSGEPERADSIRKVLLEHKDAAAKSPIRAVRSVLTLLTTADKKDAVAMMTALGLYLDRAGDLRDGKKGIEAALSIKSEASMWLALGHLDQLLAAGTDASAYVAKLKLETMSEGRVGTPDGRLLDQVRKIQDGGEIEKISARAKGFELKYYAAIAYLKQISKGHEYVDKASRTLSSARKLSEPHIDALLDSLKAFKPCSSCKGSRKIACFACRGSGKREIVCGQCSGEGTIPWDDRIEKSDKRKQIDGILGLPKGKSYCPSCLGRPDTKKRSEPCAFCETKAFVECQRCKWQKLTLETVGKLQPCENCDSSGFQFSKVMHPCAFCKGLGEFLVPSAASDAVVGPLR